MVKTKQELGLEGLPGVLSWLGTGSRHIVNPPVMDTDEDYVLLVKDVFEADAWLECNGFARPSTEEDYELEESSDLLFTYRKDNLNLLVIESPSFFNKWSIATYLAKQFNLAKKEDRVALFKYVLYGEL